MTDRQANRVFFHVYPRKDFWPHTLSGQEACACECNPDIHLQGGDFVLFLHRHFDGERETTAADYTFCLDADA